MSDAINPEYYKGDIECIDAIETVTKNLSGNDAVCTANVIKYMWRWNEKGGTNDLLKASWYINHILEKKKSDDLQVTEESVSKKTVQEFMADKILEEDDDA